MLKHPRCSRSGSFVFTKSFYDRLLSFLQITGNYLGIGPVTYARGYSDALRFVVFKDPYRWTFLLAGSRTSRLFGHPKPKRRIRDPQGIMSRLYDDGDIGGHTGHEFEIPVVHLDHNIVGDDVLHNDGGLPDLPDLSLERGIGISVNSEIYLLPEFHQPYVRLGHVRVDLHLCEVLGYCEQRRRLETRGNGLTHIDVPGYHHTVDRREDLRVFKVLLGVIK